jgi:chemotaxis signal transduction protein
MLQNSAHDAPGRREVVSFKVAEQDFCIDIGVVREIRGWTPTTVLPHAQDYVKGVVNLEGPLWPSWTYLHDWVSGPPNPKLGTSSSS